MPQIRKVSILMLPFFPNNGTPTSKSISCTYHVSLCVRKPTIWVPTRSDANRAVQSQTEILDISRRGIVLLCSENKGADQLRGYSEADLRLCFRPSILFVFLCSGSCIHVVLKFNDLHLIFNSILNMSLSRLFHFIITRRGQSNHLTHLQAQLVLSPMFPPMQGLV